MKLQGIVRSCALAIVLLSSACSKRAEPAPGDLLSQVRTALAEREKKITSYRYKGITEQGGQKAEFAFTFKAPGKMRGELMGGKMIFAFDGRRFRQWDEATQRLTEIDLDSAPKDRAAMLLHRAFAPFAPDGWRAPLLAGKLEAKEIAGEKRQISVTARATADGESAAMNFQFAPPVMDFLGKSVEGGGSVRVIEQHCEQTLGLCFPKKIEESRPGMPASVTTLSQVELNGAAPAELFELPAPAGASVEKRELQ